MYQNKKIRRAVRKKFRLIKNNTIDIVLFFI